MTFMENISIVQHLFTCIISIPCAGALVFLMIRLSKSCVRASTQLSLHCWTWILYFLSGFIHAFYVLVRYQGGVHIYNEPIFKLSIIFHVCFVILLPFAVLMATLDRCISLRFPTHYALFNGETVRILTIIGAVLMIFASWSWIYYIASQTGSSDSCFLVECLDPIRFIHTFIVYKVIFGLINLIATSIFIYLFSAYQLRGRGLDKIKNTLMFIILVAEITLNVIPPLIYWIIYTFLELELINIFAPLIFACVNLDGLCTVLVYIITYKRKQKQFHQCRPRQHLSININPLKWNRPLSRSSTLNSITNIKVKDQPPFVRAVSS